jgi:hypothetical protein
VHVRDEKGSDLSGAKVTVDWITGSDTTKTDVYGQAYFERLPVGKRCSINVEKKEFEPDKYELTLKLGKTRDMVELKPTEPVQKLLKVSVADEGMNKITDARVRISDRTGVLKEDRTDNWGSCELEIPKTKGMLYVFAQKEGYTEQRKELIEGSMSFMLKPGTAKLTLSVLNEKNMPISNAKVEISDKHGITNEKGNVVVTGVALGTHKLRITKEGYAPYEKGLSVEGDLIHDSRLATEYGSLNVKVFDMESKDPIEAIEVYISGTSEKTNKEGFVHFKVPVGTQIIEVRDPTGVYSSKSQPVEIKTKTQIELNLSGSFEIPDTTTEKLRAASKYLEDQRERVAAYDCYLPDYYNKIGERIVELVINPGKSRNILRVVRGIPSIKPEVFMEDLADVISNACMEIGKGMRERRNLELFEDIKRFVVDKGLAKANVEVYLKSVESEDIKKYITRGEGGAEELLREIDQSLTQTGGNIYPMSVLFRIAREIMNSGAGADDKEARALVVSVILEYVRIMLNDDNAKERLKGLIT